MRLIHNLSLNRDTEILAPVSSSIIMESCVTYSLWFQKIFFGNFNNLNLRGDGSNLINKKQLGCESPRSHTLHQAPEGSLGKLSFKQHFGEGILDGLLEGDDVLWNPV